MKSWFAMVFILSIPALVAAQESCANKTSSGARVERAAPVVPYRAFDQWVSFEPQFL